MKRRLKIAVLCAIMAISVGLLAACAAEDIIGDLIDKGYTCTITYDFAGGKVGERETGYYMTKADSLLIKPGVSVQGNMDEPIRVGYRLVGWFRGEKSAITDADGNVTYEITYGEEWNYSSHKVTGNLTLFAKWVRRAAFVVNYYETVKSENNEFTTVVKQDYYYVEDGESRDSFNDPVWTNHTFLGKYYYDSDCQGMPVEFPITHTGGDEDKQIMLYTEWLDGSYELVYSADDLARISPSRNYYLMNNIDFEGKSWRMPDMYTGSFEGNGYTISNLKVNTIQSGAQFSFGLFGELYTASVSAPPTIRDVTFENVDMTVEIGRSNAVGVGMIAGRVSQDSVIENVTLTSCTLTLVKDASAVGTIHKVEKLAANVAAGAKIINCDYDNVTVIQTEKG